MNRFELLDYFLMHELNISHPMNQHMTNENPVQQVSKTNQ